MMVGTIIAGVAALLFAALAAYYWRETSRAQTMLVEGANGYEELRRGYHQLEKKLADVEETKAKFAEQYETMEEEMDKARRRATDLASQLQIRGQQEQVRLEKLELQKGHLQKEAHRFQAEADHYRNQVATMEAELTELRQGLKDWDEKKLEPLRQKLNESRNEVKKVSAERDKLQRLVETINPSEIKRVKRKLTQYGRLYASMKGLREMSEERNRNWEVALEKLSLWILKQKRPGSVTPGKAVGPLVGEALQAIGEQLVDDGEQAFDPHHHHAEHETNGGVKSVTAAATSKHETATSVAAANEGP